MSSILKALKKLESEKAQRDELSTAVASDILRSSRRKRRRSYSLVVFFGCFAVFAFLSAGYYLVRTRDATESTVRVVDEPAAKGKPESIATPEVLPDDPPVETTAEQADFPVELPRLSGIVFQEQPENRLAIINDLPVMEGTRVEGYEVSRILPDRVILSHDVSVYEIVLESH